MCTLILQKKEYPNDFAVEVANVVDKKIEVSYSTEKKNTHPNYTIQKCAL
jgi:hypothetical protein